MVDGGRNAKEKPAEAGRAATPGAAGWVGAVKIHGTGVSVFRYRMTLATKDGGSGTGVGRWRGDSLSEPRQGLIHNDLLGRFAQ